VDGEYRESSDSKWRERYTDEKRREGFYQKWH
jgi:hypothetical protein